MHTDIPGTVRAVDAQTGAVTVRTAGVDVRLTVPATLAETLRPGSLLSVQVLFVREPAAPGTPGGGPAPAMVPAREVHRPEGADPREHPDMVVPPPER